jgi:hypothetical protein
MSSRPFSHLDGNLIGIANYITDVTGSMATPALTPPTAADASR